MGGRRASDYIIGMDVQQISKKRTRRASRAGARQVFYASPTVAAEAEHYGSLAVNVSIAAEAIDPALVRKLIGARMEARNRSQTTGITKVIREAAKEAVSEVLRVNLASEVAKVVSASRVMLRDGFARGEDPALQAALNRARLQEKILASTTMVDQS